MGNYIYYGYNSVRRTITSEPAVKKVDTVASVVEVRRPDCESTPIEKVTVITTPIVKEEPQLEKQKNVEEKVKEVKVEEKKEVKEVKEVKKVEEVKEVKKVEEVKKEVKKVEEKKVEEKKVEEVKEVKKVEEIKEAKKEVKKVEEKKVEEKKVEEKKVEEKKVEEKKVEEKKVEGKKEVNEKIVIDLKSVTKEKAKSPLLTPIEEESMNIHPYLLEYGTEPFKSDILLIQNEFYQPNKKKNKKKKNQPNVFSEE